jgi:hypothetical protein
LFACSVVGCGNETDETPNGSTNNATCLMDSDCVSERVCSFEHCVPTCTTSAECSNDDECKTRLGGAPEKICLPYEYGLNSSPDAVYAMLITDLTTGDGCLGDDPGSDMIYAALETLDGMVLGYASLEYDGTTGQPNAYDLGVNLDGSAPEFEGVCPEFADTNVTSLGCGGKIGLKFQDAESFPNIIVPGEMQVRVFEYGDQCSTGSTADEFEVSLCTNFNAVFNDGNTASCGSPLGGGSGETVISF